MTELRKMQKTATRELGFSVESTGDNMMIWNVYMHTDGFDPDQQLTKSLKKNGILVFRH